MSIQIVETLSTAVHPQPVQSEERRSRGRLRELCDEVLASYRVAQSKDLWTTAERDEARAMLARIAPGGRA